MIRKIVIIFAIIPFSFYSFGVEQQKLSFHLKFGFFKAGESVLTISDTTFNGKPAIYYFQGVRTMGLIEHFFKLNDFYESIVNPENLLPYKSIRNVNQGNYHRYNEVLYFHDIDSILSQRSGKRAVPKNLVDILSVFFYFTNSGYLEKLNSGEIITIPVFNADEITDVKIQFEGFKTVKTGKGDIECYVIAPQADKGKEIMGSNGLKFYISRKNKLPVLFEFDMKIGVLRAILKSYTVDGKEEVLN